MDSSRWKTTDQALRPSSRRGASGTWRKGDRLKPAPADTLELYGLPSKGETRLNDFRTQEFYFQKILERYMRLCAINEKQLDTLFASMSLNSNHPTTDLTGSSLTLPAKVLPAFHPPAPTSASASAPLFSSPSQTELSTVLSALRKLREALTASARKDAFARRAFHFGVHAGVLCKDWESYAPALRALLEVIHRQSPLSASELKEYVGLTILDQACRQGDIALAYTTRLRYGHKDRRLDLVLKSLVADDWVVFWKMKKAVDGYQRSVMEFSEREMRLHALKCLGRAYMSADRKFVEVATDRQWADLVQDGVGWELTDADKVVIKKPKGK